MNRRGSGDRRDGTVAGDGPVELASSPCMMPDVDPAYMGLMSDAAAGGAARMVDEGAMGRALLHALPDGVMFADRDGLIRHWNAGCERIFGFTAEEVLGRSLDVIIPERLRARHWSGYHHSLETGESRYGPGDMLSVPALTRDGRTISVEFTLAPVQGADGGQVGFVAVLRDVTARFAELKRLRAAGGAD